MNKKSGPLKYVLFSHYARDDDAESKKYLGGEISQELDGVQHLIAHFRGLKQLLNSPGHEGMLVLFYAPGYARFLKALSEGVDKDLEEGFRENVSDEALRAILNKRNAGREDEEGVNRLMFARAVSTLVRSKLQDHELQRKVRFITSWDLNTILGRVHQIATDQFERYLVGHSESLRYDAPKVAEAILRLRLLGNGIPVLRVDHDVIFRGDENWDTGDLGMFKAIACSVRAYQLRLAEPTISTFIFSSSYNVRKLVTEREAAQKRQEGQAAAVKLVDGRGDAKGRRLKPGQASRLEGEERQEAEDEKRKLEKQELEKQEDERFDGWSRAFATRIYPALVVDPPKLKEIEAMPAGQGKTEAEKRYVGTNLNAEFAKSFYGIERIGGGKIIPKPTNDGLPSIGAHPQYSVISGALLCLSEGAILDLPPFSNFRENVMWIDDHLKYCIALWDDFGDKQGPVWSTA